MSRTTDVADFEFPADGLNVGVTANRWRLPGEADNMRLNPAHNDSLQATVRFVLTLIGETVQAKYSAEKHAESSAAIRLISPLAEGGDRVVATVATALPQPWELIVITPEDISLLPNRDAHIPLLPLWNVAKARVLLGGQQLDDESLLAVNRLLLQHSDLLVSLWDNQPARGAAGTENVINQALEQGIPVVVIDAEPMRADAATAHAFRVVLPDRRISKDNDDNTLRDVVTRRLRPRR